MSDFENSFDRARQMMSSGLSNGDIMRALTESGVEPSIAYFAVVGAQLDLENRGRVKTGKEEG